MDLVPLGAWNFVGAWILELGAFLIGPVAQRLEQGTHNPLVPGSNPGGPSLRFAAQRKAEAATP